MSMNRREIQNLIKLAAGSFPNVQTKELTEIGNSWEQMLGNLSYQQAHEALRRVLRTARFWPTVAEILDAVGAIAEERQRQTFMPGQKSACPNCEGSGYISIMQSGDEECYARCPCAAGEKYNGWPMAPSWAIVSDRSMIKNGQEVKEAMSF